MVERSGWLLDLYADPRGGLALWFLDENGERQRLRQDFPVTFYAAGPAARLRAAWRWLQGRPGVSLARQERRDLFQPGLLPVLAVQVAQPAAQPALFRQVSQAFPDLTYYDADLPLALRHAALHGTFPLARGRLAWDESGTVQALSVLDSPWDLDPEPAPLRILSLEPEVDPFHAAPTQLLVRDLRTSYRLALEPARPLLVNLRAILQRHDPDLLLTTWGDTWLLPRLLALSQEWRIPLPLSRDVERGVAYRKERSYFTYGQIIYRGRQVHLFGRWHVDGHNAMLFHDYGMEGALEMARVTALPLQTAARVSPGSGISAMQIITALRQGVLVPWHKQQAERPKTALELMRFDQGGLVYQPTTGLHFDVGEVDFISMYPSIMRHFNISPETVGSQRPTAELAPRLEETVSGGPPGLVPETLAPLLDKRLALKLRLAELPAWHPQRLRYKARASAHKWLLVTCFGYLGYKNARFGRIEAHEAVTAYGREALLRAKEAAEDLGFEVLHLYVDGMWVKKAGASRVADFQPVLDEIVRRTGLPVALEGVYRWLAFLPSRQDGRVPVANRYFGAYQDGTLKVRGVEARRRDTPHFLVRLQEEMLERLAQAQGAGAASTAAALQECLPGLVARLRRVLAALRAGRIPLAELVVAHKLSRDLTEFRTPSPAARAAGQLQAAGKVLKPGQRVLFIYTRGEPGVHAWDLPQPPNPASVDVARYAELTLRAAAAILQPLRVEEATLRQWLFSNAGYLAPPGKPAPPATALPLWVGKHVLRDRHLFPVAGLRQISWLPAP